MALGSRMVWVLKLLCLIGASVCLLPYLASRTDTADVWSRIASRGINVKLMSAKYAPSEGTRILKLSVYD